MMKYLLDTHILFWSMCDENKLSASVLDLINNPENEIYYSAVSVWEVVLRHRKKPENMPVNGYSFIDGCVKAGYIPLSIENSHILTVDSLRRQEDAPKHNDPFDKMLIAQVKFESMVLITHDGLLSGYNEECVMKV